MRRSHLLTGLAAVLVFAACADPMGPEPGASGTDPVSLLWHLSADRSGDGAADSELDFLEISEAAPLLETYETSFKACGWRSQTLQIRYESASGGDGLFLELTIPKGSITNWPKGRTFASWQCVVITVKVDRSRVAAEFGPGGLKFSQSTPAVLRMSYAQADPDYSGDGVVDLQDESIWNEQLGLWRLADKKSAWQLIPSVHDKEAKRLDAKLFEFSQYGTAH